MITYYSANKVLDYYFGQTAGAPPTSYFYGLSTQTITISGTGAVEPTTGNYARVEQVNNKLGNWKMASNAVLRNNTAVQFNESQTLWGTITYVGMWDFSTSGNIWWYDALSPSRTVEALTTVLFAIDAITVSMSNA